LTNNCLIWSSGFRTLPLGSRCDRRSDRFGETHAQIACCACECCGHWSSRARRSRQCERGLLRLRGGLGRPRRRRRGRDCWRRHSEQSATATAGLLSAPAPRLSSTAARSSLPAVAGLCSAGIRLSLGTPASQHSGGIWYFVMKFFFPNCRAQSELRAVLIVAAVLALGILTKLDSSIQLFHLSH
jgi:hypothetical protein